VSTCVCAVDTKSHNSPRGSSILVELEFTALVFVDDDDENEIYLTNKEASTVLCSVVKHAGSGRAQKKCRGKHKTESSVFPHFLSALPLPKCFTTEQSTVEASLLFYDKESDNFSTHSAEFSNQTLFSKRVYVASAVCCCLIKHAK